MNKKNLFFAILAILALGALSMACSGKITVGQGTSVNGQAITPGTYDYAADEKGNMRVSPGTQAPVAGAALQAGSTTVLNPAAKTAANPAITVPNNAAAPAAPRISAPTGPTLIAPPDAITIDQFQTLLDVDPYKIIDRLDSVRNAKEDHPQGGWDATAGPNEIKVIWMGIYSVPDPTYGGKLVKYRVDGRTGVYILPSGNSVHLSGPGAAMKVVYKDANVDHSNVLQQVLGDTLTIVDPKSRGGASVSLSATSCVGKNDVVTVINANKSNQGVMYEKLDEIVGSNPTARLRSGSAATITAKSGMTLVWVQAGQLTGQTVMSLDVHDGKMLALVLKDGAFEVPYPFSGVEVCQKIDPAVDFLPWWGK